MCPNNSSRKEISVCAVQAPQRRSCVESGEDGLGDARLPDEVWGVPSFAVTPKSCYRLVRPGDTAARCGGFIPDGGSHPSGGHGAA